MFELIATLIILNVIIIFVISRSFKNCNTCKHLDDSLYHSKCNDCYDNDGWEPKE